MPGDAIPTGTDIPLLQSDKPHTVDERTLFDESKSWTSHSSFDDSSEEKDNVIVPAVLVTTENLSTSVIDESWPTIVSLKLIAWGVSSLGSTSVAKVELQHATKNIANTNLINLDRILK